MSRHPVCLPGLKGTTAGCTASRCASDWEVAIYQAVDRRFELRALADNLFHDGHIDRAALCISWNGAPDEMALSCAVSPLLTTLAPLAATRW